MSEYTKKMFTQDILDIHSDLVKAGLGCCTTMTAKLILKNDIQPKYCKPCKLPFALKPIVGAKLDCLEKDRVLEKNQPLKLGNPYCGCSETQWKSENMRRL